MNTQQAIDYFGGKQQLADALGISLPALYQAAWNPNPPWVRQIQIETLTRGKLKADPECRENLKPQAKRVPAIKPQKKGH